MLQPSVRGAGIGVVDATTVGENARTIDEQSWYRAATAGDGSEGGGAVLQSWAKMPEPALAVVATSYDDSHGEAATDGECCNPWANLLGPTTRFAA